MGRSGTFWWGTEKLVRVSLTNSREEEEERGPLRVSMSFFPSCSLALYASGAVSGWMSGAKFTKRRKVHICNGKNQTLQKVTTYLRFWRAVYVSPTYHSTAVAQFHKRGMMR
jgi:hypothetical protein